MVYFKYDKLPAEETILSNKAWNQWIDEHHYATCSHCGKEYLYADSPVLKDSLWQKIIKKYDLEELNANSEKLHSRAIVTSYENNAEKILGRLNTIAREIVPNSEHCTLCVECMEEALGRKLTKDDLVNCTMNKAFIEKFGL